MIKQDETSDRYEKLDSHFEALIKSWKRLVHELEDLLEHLPVFDEDGNTKCPSDMAKNLFAQKARKEKVVQQELDSITEHLRDVEETIRRFRANRSMLSSDRGRLESDLPSGHYRNAEALTVDRLARAIQQRNKLRDLIKLFRSTLSKSKSRQFPGELDDGDESELPLGTWADSVAALDLILRKDSVSMPPPPPPPRSETPGMIPPPPPRMSFDPALDSLIRNGPYGGNPPPGPPAPQGTAPGGYGA